MSARFRVVVLLAVFAVLAGSGGQAGWADDPAVLTVWTENSSVNLFPDDRPKSSSGSTIALVAAKNDYEAAQIGIRGDRPFTVRRVGFSALTDGPNTIAGTNVTYQFVEFEHLNHNTSFMGQYPLDNPLRPAPGYFPDTLSNNVSVPVPANSTQPIWVRAYVPTGTPPGHYAGTATVVTDVRDVAVPIELEVVDATIPAADQSAFTNAMWNTAFGPLTYDHPADMMKMFYDFDRFSPKWWTLLDNIAASMRLYRGNDLSVPTASLLLDGGSRLDSKGNYQFNWSRFDQVVSFFLDRHAVKQIEAFWLFYGLQKPDNVIRTHIITADTAGNPVLRWVDSDSAAVKKWNQQYLTALRDHIRANGWSNRFWMHIADEITDEQVPRYRAAVRTVRQIWPDVRIADANNIQSSQEAVAGDESFLIPSLISADDNPEYYADQRQNGKDFWLYTANIPTGSYLNRFIDQPVYAQREMMWYAHQLGATGYLHWGYNDWLYQLDDQDTKGDGWIVKWDKEHTSIRPTIRLEALRDGIEDWELLSIVGRDRPGLAKALTEAVVTKATRYNQDSGYLSRLHGILARAAAGEPIPQKMTTVTTVGSDGGAKWWRFDLTNQAQVDALTVVQDRAQEFKVQLSYDGTKWADAYSGANQFVGINGKARYVRILCTDCSIRDVRIAGHVLPRPNLAGGRPYERPAPLDDFPDPGNTKSTDGVLAGHFTDGRSYGYEITDGKPLTKQVTVDLQAVKPVDTVRIHAYEKYEQQYAPDTVALSTSADGITFTPVASQRKPNGSDGNWYDFGFALTSARYLKVVFTKNYGPTADYLFLDDIEAYGR